MQDYLAKCLNDAADLIERLGWVQKAWFHSGGYCMIGAVRAVCPRFRTAESQEEDQLADALKFPCVGSAIRWNDTPGRTKEEVVARLRAGAARVAERPEAGP